MSDISDASDLIATARDALLADLLPALPKDRRYTGLMIANAMAIATREERLGFDALRSEAGRLRNLLADVGASPAQPVDPVESELATLRARVRDAIRDGLFDAPAHWHALVAALLHTAADRVAISNPKALREDAAASAR
ncbi:MAG TPA: DUF6285 domain-containing protein [Casimicrobiaceae bacterium]|nr:DUF6285 domain-containing protein [Casimicrobiaceae bacterium]